MLSLSPDEVMALPVDELALRVLDDFMRTSGWNEHNYLIQSQQHFGQHSKDVVPAIAEALSWARAHAFLARRHDQSTSEAVFVTRLGQAALSSGVTAMRATIRLSAGLHPEIEQRARRQFLLGEAEQAVFVAMKAVEVRVRRLAGLTDADYGVPLMNRAFGPTGPLTDPASTPGEQEGTRCLFVGAYAVLRNPSGHTDVDYSDVAEAAEAVTTASLLMRMLDKVEHRRVATS